MARSLKGIYRNSPFAEEPSQQQRLSEDWGFSSKTQGKRLLNKNGSFNIQRIGSSEWNALSLYQHLLAAPWWQFYLLVLLVFLGVNSFFALLYLYIGIENINGTDTGIWSTHFYHAFFFSVQTFTTVGYGGMAPQSVAAGAISSFEALTGVMGFALATGLLYGRFSRPSAKILFSQNAVIAPFEDGWSFQFRLANERSNQLVNLEANVILSTLEMVNQTPKRRYYQIDLTANRIFFFPLNWTIVHPITPESPLYGKTAADLKNLDAEFLVLIKGYDDSFAQEVYSPTSYKWDEIVWNARFVTPFYPSETGNTIMDLGAMNRYETVS
ncbi:hypothetical protein C7N43_23020 [Sphingobacteriales bacterium UPWRP_1]|nr:hypothetical protein B6N25_05810 [Sphingobacteriales bacterium TSM_CSS]PSJ74622.1 hypothetical protein C7N43_23020 [Sphingobacteriales bacterium UPWRP_1]